jgi:hypothetical protein
MDKPTPQPLFQDGQTSAQHQPGMTSGDSPRDPHPAESTDTQSYADYLKWRDDQRADSSNHTESDRLGADVNKTETDKRAVDTARPTAPKTAVKQDLPEKTTVEEETPQSYVWLANGQVLLVDDEDLPGHAGGTAQHGFWQQGDKVHSIVGVYAKEITVKGN